MKRKKPIVINFNFKFNFSFKFEKLIVKHDGQGESGNKLYEALSILIGLAGLILAIVLR